MIQSMTAYASRTGAQGAYAWTWDMRGVNARGLDLRLRLPEGLPALEAAARAALAARLARGNVTLSLRLSRSDAGPGLALDEAHLARVIDALARIGDQARGQGLALAPATAADILALRGVVLTAAPEPDTPDDTLQTTLRADLDMLIDDFIAMRQAEGRALAAILTLQLDRIAALTAEAATLAHARRDDTRAALTAAFRRVRDDIPDLDETRLVQELALLAVKSDVTEELDRLNAHIAAARALLADPHPQGRKLDFLAQEFNREANTLCSKAQSADLTRTGLDLKAVIDQMREQIQNVE